LQYVQEYFDLHGLSYENMGVKTADEDMKLEDMIPPVTKKVLEVSESRGVLICGTGVGVEVGANKFSGIRASLATNPQIAEYAAVYDKCNVICLVGWDDDKVKVHKILDAWIHAEYDGNEKRLKMFEEFNKWH
jgi:RpiB/LacA/LacB family sugar-phosphate isomerase